ncbi:MAG: PKD domain-containing protein, partial [Flavobacteriales bacterium]
MRNPFYLLLFAFIAPVLLPAQGVTIGSNNPPDPSAVLDLQSNQSGLLLPRLTTAQRNSIALPSRALVIYNTDNECVEGYFPGGWKALQCDCNSAPNSPSSISGPTVACPADTGLLFSIATVSGATSYAWTIGSTDTIISGTGSDSLRMNLSSLTGLRTISVAAQNYCGTSAPAILSLSVALPDSSFTVQPATPIINNAAQFNANQSNATYAWTFPSGSPGSSAAQNPSVTWTQTGTYAVQLTVTDANGCQSQNTDSVTVTNCSPATYTFSNCGQTGRTGPSQAQCNASYGSGVVTVSNGVQLWTVPATGNYTIQAAGAEGGDKGDYLNQSGKGTIVSGSVSLTAGTVLAIVVGQRGGQSLSANSSGGGGGGGGSFVYNSQSNVLYVAAGGGGGIGAGNSTRKPGRNASTSQSSGTNQQDNNNGPSSYNYFAITGNGGGSYGQVIGQGDYDSGGGAGWNGNGMNGVQYPGTEGGRSRVNGFLGGNFDSSRSPYVAVGGFGGGGGAS